MTVRIYIAMMIASSFSSSFITVDISPRDAEEEGEGE